MTFLSQKNVNFFICVQFLPGRRFCSWWCNWQWLALGDSSEKQGKRACTCSPCWRCSEWILIRDLYMFFLVLETKTHTCHKLIHVHVAITLWWSFTLGVSVLICNQQEGNLVDLDTSVRIHIPKIEVVHTFRQV